MRQGGGLGQDPTHGPVSILDTLRQIHRGGGAATFGQSGPGPAGAIIGKEPMIAEPTEREG